MIEKWQYTQLGKISKKFKLKTFQEIVSKEKRSLISGPFGSNISSKFFVKTGVPVIRGNNLKEELITFIDEGFVYVTPEKAGELNCYAKKNDIIFTAAGTIGQIGIITKKNIYNEYVISNKQIRARIDENQVLPMYCYYWLKQPKIIKLIKQLNTGSTIPLINLGIVKKLPIAFPILETQEKIASILSALDDKIEINNEMNKTLEEMAQTLFKRWFIDFDFPNENGEPYRSSGGKM
ncbi:restriction endonuclease subunit S, partial [Cetobacterium sp. ZOR0034]